MKTTLLLLLPLLSHSLCSQDWPAFRGAKGDGISTTKSVPLRWDSKTNVKWKVALPRAANGSPIVSNGRVFVACTEDDKGKKRALYCFDRSNGKKLWAQTVSFGKVMPTHKTNPYCGSTPAADGERVVVWHGSAGLHCYDFHGKKLWARSFGDFKHRWGYGTSPVIHKGMVILHSGPGEKVFLTAIDLATGATIWKASEPVNGNGEDNGEGRLMGSWCTPVITKVGKQEVILCTMSTRLVAYHANDGQVLWWCEGLSCHRGDLAYSSPVVVGDTALITAGYDGPDIGVRMGGNGDVTKSHRLWRNPKQPSNCGSGVLAEGYVYMPDMRGFVACIDPKTGDRVWSTRVAKGQIWSSIVYAAGRLFVMNQKGTTIVFKPNPKQLEVIAKNELGEETNATPAISDGEIFLRTHEHLYCIAKKKAPASKPAKSPTSRKGR